jgi:hypothetical protein
MWQKVAKFKGAEYFRKALYVWVSCGQFAIYNLPSAQEEIGPRLNLVDVL